MQNTQTTVIHMRKSCVFFLMMLLMPAFTHQGGHLWAQGPNGSGVYYQEADGLKGSALKTKLSEIISKKTRTPSYDDLIELYMETDVRPDGFLRDWYSNSTKYTPGSKPTSYSKEGDTYNREHSVPQSWGAPKTDIMHVVPTDGYVNNRRSNYPFGEVGTPTYSSYNDYCKLGYCKTPGYSGKVFEPNDEVKGDLARIYFYMATCYESTITSWSGGGIITGTKYQPYEQWTFDMLVRWSVLDPVDSVEIARNNAVAKKNVQGNRNPFVDYPGLEDYIWGMKTDVAFSYDHYENASWVVTDRVATPRLSPGGGTYTDQVQVSISCDTEGAVIHYTTNGTEVSQNSPVYTEPLTFTSNTTLKAIAVKEDMSTSFQASATYVIKNGQTGDDNPADGMIAFGNKLFGTNYTGSIAKSDNTDLIGTQQGVTVVYSLGASGSNRYCNDSQIRLYQYNTLTISVSEGTLTSLEFQLAESTTKKLEANVGTVTDYTWTGDAKSVTFNVDEGSKHVKLTGVKVTTSQTAGIKVAKRQKGRRHFHSVSGARADDSRLRPGVLIRNGKKYLVK